ncbi:C-X-C motif chemokine 9 [Lycaon pictus]
MFSKEILRFEIQYRSESVELHSTDMKKGGVPFLLRTPIMRNRRCSCITTSQGTIQSKFLKDIKQFAPSSSCEKTEIIQKKKQKKGEKYQKSKQVLKLKKSQRPHQKKMT